MRGYFNLKSMEEFKKNIEDLPQQLQNAIRNDIADMIAWWVRNGRQKSILANIAQYKKAKYNT